MRQIGHRCPLVCAALCSHTVTGELANTLEKDKLHDVLFVRLLALTRLSYHRFYVLCPRSGSIGFGKSAASIGSLENIVDHLLIALQRVFVYFMCILRWHRRMPKTCAQRSSSEWALHEHLQKSHGSSPMNSTKVTRQIEDAYETYAKHVFENIQLESLHLRLHSLLFLWGNDFWGISRISRKFSTGHSFDSGLLSHSALKCRSIFRDYLWSFECMRKVDWSGKQDRISENKILIFLLQFYS